MREDYQHELIPGPDIDFNEIRDLFDPMLWDVGYLNDVGFQRASAAPVKTKLHPQSGVEWYCSCKIH